ncbi:MAG: vitamin K epoxide reductase family protein [Candidatus Babeliales bacterium]
MMTLIMIVAAIGLCISLYTYSVERKIKTNAQYKPACDLSDRISCTKPMLSEYANMFYFSNAFIGTSYYVLIILLAAFNMLNLLFIAASAACLFSLFLAYILYVKIKAFCILCTSIYLVNFIILGLVLYSR